MVPAALPLLLSLLCLTTSSITALHRGSLCKALGGTCQKKINTCRTRIKSDFCEQEHLGCCLPEKRQWWNSDRPAINTKRIYNRLETCGTDSKPCINRGGHCQSKESTCNTVAINRFCKASSCKCCLGNHKKCKGGIGCKLRGGFCIKGNKKQCKKGKVLGKACKGKKCSCCVPRQCSCGIPNSERIIGGAEVVPAHSYPWMVGLHLRNISNFYFCGGAIINPHYIITAAHCLFNATTKQPYNPNEIKIGVADHKQFSDEDDMPGVTKLVDVIELILPKNYRFSDTDDDISLIRLASPLDLTSHDQVRAVCLPTNPKEDYSGETGMAYGWGVLDSGVFMQPDEIRQVPLPIWGLKCDNIKVAKVKITEKMLCAGRKEGGKDTCMGDSGGPLTVEKDGIHTLVGVTSFGSGCGKPNSPGVYTRITQYLDWIYEHTLGTSFCNDK